MLLRVKVAENATETMQKFLKNFGYSGPQDGITIDPSLISAANSFQKSLETKLQKSLPPLVSGFSLNYQNFAQAVNSFHESQAAEKKKTEEAKKLEDTKKEEPKKDQKSEEKKDPTKEEKDLKSKDSIKSLQAFLSSSHLNSSPYAGPQDGIPTDALTSAAQSLESKIQEAINKPTKGLIWNPIAKIPNTSVSDIQEALQIISQNQDKFKKVNP